MARDKWILVTGGAGLIGTNLCQELLAKGKKVICLDNFCTSSPENLVQFQANPNFRLLKADLNTISPHELQSLDLESIYNLACPASPVQYERLSVETLTVCTVGVQKLLQLAQAKSIPMLHASTSEIYGDPEESPQNEDYWGNVNSFGPRSCYDEGKRVAEAFCYVYLHKHNVDIRLARIFNTYGPYLNAEDGRVVSNFITQGLAGKDITIYGDGSQTRSFCYVKDTVAGLIKLLELNRAKLPPKPICNIGNPNEMTVQELAEMIADVTATGKRSKIVNLKAVEDDPKQRRPDIRKAKHYLHWKPTTTLKRGLAQTIDYFKSKPVVKESQSYLPGFISSIASKVYQFIQPVVTANIDDHFAPANVKRMNKVR